MSCDEIYSESEPRNFSLQKIVEVAHYNLSRMSNVWDKIWIHMSEHLSEMGCHQSQSIAMRSIDAMRQLSMKFLTVESLSRDFLKPFHHIIIKSNHMLIREVVKENMI